MQSRPSARIRTWLLACLMAALPFAGAHATGNFFSDGSQPDLLPAEQAFTYNAEMPGTELVIAHFNIADGYYLYKSRMSFELAGGDNRILGVRMPDGDEKDDPNFGRLFVFHHQADVSIRLAKPAPKGVTLIAHYQGCADAGVCYPPITKQFAIAPSSGGPGLSNQPAGPDAPAPPPGSEFGRLTSLLQGSSTPLILLGFFAAGLLLAFSACMYPMIPILSGIIAGDGHQRSGRRAFLLSLIYVESTAVTYAVAGAAAGVSGEAIQADLQGPWVLGGFAALFVVLSLSMFGLYTLQMPAAIQTRLDNLSRKQRGGSFLGAAIMGALSALIVSACSGPALVAALAFIAKTGDPWMGGLALFALANGMGVPLLAIGTAAGRWLPKSGPWMNRVKPLFGLVFLGVALIIVERLIPGPVALGLWGVLLLSTAVYLGAFRALPQSAGRLLHVEKVLAVVILLWGALLIVGASAGGDRFWEPLHRLTSIAASPTASPTAQAPAFRKVASLGALKAAIRQAADEHRTAMVDVYADWCAYCVQLDRQTFPDRKVRNALRNSVLLRVDVTAMNEADKKLLEQLDVFLPPAVLFYGADGRERKNLRVVGFMGPDDFTQRARQALRVD